MFLSDTMPKINTIRIIVDGEFTGEEAAEIAYGMSDALLQSTTTEERGDLSKLFMRIAMRSFMKAATTINRNDGPATDNATNTVKPDSHVRKPKVNPKKK